MRTLDVHVIPAFAVSKKAGKQWRHCTLQLFTYHNDIRGNKRFLSPVTGSVNMTTCFSLRFCLHRRGGLVEVASPCSS